MSPSKIKKIKITCASQNIFPNVRFLRAYKYFKENTQLPFDILFSLFIKIMLKSKEHNNNRDRKELGPKLDTGNLGVYCLAFSMFC